MHIEIKGFGPHRHAVAELRGSIVRPSEWGKSTLLDLALWALTGRDRANRPVGPEVVRHDTPRGEVTIGWGDHEVSRTMTSRGSGSVKLDGAKVSNAEMLSLLSTDDTTLRLVGAPLYWRSLADGERSGAPFLEALVSLLASPARVEAEVRATIPDYSPANDGENAKRAKDVRRDANRDRDQAEGRLGEARRALAALEGQEVAQVSPERVERARAWLEWHEQAAVQRRAQEEADRWRRQREAIDYEGQPRPEGEIVAEGQAVAAKLRSVRGRKMGLEYSPGEAVVAARSTVEAWEQADRYPAAVYDAPDDYPAEVVEMVREHLDWLEKGDEHFRRAKTLEEQAAQARRDAEKGDRHASERARTIATLRSEIEALDDSGSCPTCGQEWAEHAAHVAEQRARLEGQIASEQKRRDDLVEQAERDRARATALDAESNEAVVRGRAWHTESDVARNRIRDRLAAARGELDCLATEDRRGHDAAVAELDTEIRRLDERREQLRAELQADRLGPCPEVPETEEAPSDLGERSARDIIQQAEQQETLRAARAEHIEQASAAVGRAEEAHTKAQAAADRAQAVVAALEAAPGKVLARELDALNARLDGEEVILSGDTGADMLIDGRPFYLASSGRRLLADARLRLALRDIAGLDWLPVVVDDAALWSGKWPEGVVLLLTAGGPKERREDLEAAEESVRLDVSALEREQARQRLAPSWAHTGTTMPADGPPGQPLPHGGKPSKPRRVAVIDVETADHNRAICSLAVVIVEEGEVVDGWSSLVRPDVEEIKFGETHGLTWSELHDASTLADRWGQVAGLLADCDALVAHNAAFDRRVLLADCAEQGLDTTPLQKPWLCTMQQFRRERPGEKSSLPAACKAMGLDTSAMVHHDALDDAEMCARLWVALNP